MIYRYLIIFITCFMLSNCQSSSQKEQTLSKEPRVSEVYNWVISKVRSKITSTNTDARYQPISWEKIVSYPDMNDKSYGYYIEKDDKSTYYKYTNTTVIMVEHTYRLSSDTEENTYCKAFYIYPENGYVEIQEPRYIVTPEGKEKLRELMN